MSFSSEVKEELAGTAGSARHCQLAELAAMICFGGHIIRTGSDYPGIIVRTESLSVARKCFTLFRKAFNISIEISVRRSAPRKKSAVYTLAVTEHEKACRVISAIGLTPAGDEGQCLWDDRILSRTCCRRAFLRGAFLIAGSMSNPEKGYHFEIICGCHEKAERLQDLMQSCQIDARIFLRKNRCVLYVKEGDQIVSLLGMMNAQLSLMKMENIRIVRDVRETINRQVNCEAANIARTTSAAYGQIQDIIYIQEKVGLESLPDALREAAEARLEDEDASLQELADRMDPPVTKSGMNHRLRRLREVADSLRANEEDVSYHDIKDYHY